MKNNQLVSGPLYGEGYTSDGYNNRLRMTDFGSYLVKPNHVLWVNQTNKRFSDCLENGYNGAYFDFALDDFVSFFWASSGRVSLHEQADHDQLASSVIDLFSGLSNTFLDSLIIFNGYFTVTNDNYWNYLAVTDGAIFEFLGFGYDPGASEIAYNTEEAMLIIFATHLVDKIALAKAYGFPENIAARMKSLELYLLLLNNETYYYYSTHFTEQKISYFPEWDVPLGNPLIMPLDDFNDLIVPDTNNLLLKREFENGVVYFNFAESSIDVNLGGTYYLLFVEGGFDPILGGEGRAIYYEVSGALSLPARSGVILISDPAGLSVCGNGISEGDELCDDGNLENGDGCSIFCGGEELPEYECGNGILEGGEECDDGNNVNGDGCNGDCYTEECSADRECDDGDVCTRDRCISYICKITSNVYGDVNYDDTVDLFDLYCVLDGYVGVFEDCELADVDIAPCTPDAVIDLFDIFAVLDAFQGMDSCCGAGNASVAESSDLVYTCTLTIMGKTKNNVKLSKQGRVTPEDFVRENRLGSLEC